MGGGKQGGWVPHRTDLPHDFSGASHQASRGAKLRMASYMLTYTDDFMLDLSIDNRTVFWALHIFTGL